MVKAGLTVALVAVLVAPALADYSQPSGLSIRAGWYLAQGDGKDAEGQNWFLVGFDKKLKEGSFLGAENGHFSFSADYYGKGSFSNVPVLYNYTARQDGFYYSVGAGIGFGHRQTGVSSSDSSLDFNYQFSVGKDLVKSGNVLFVEARYLGNSRPALAGFALIGGVRF